MDERIIWCDAATLTVEGRGWDDTESFYYRLPTRAKPLVNDTVWKLASNSAGMVIRFVTDAPDVKIRWKLTDALHSLNHMAETGVSGVDVYLRYQGSWQWLAVGRPSEQENETTASCGLPAEEREYALHLPLYNGVSSVEIGVAENAALRPAPPRTHPIKPVVFYGTSIVQGGCASRPGMAYPSIIGRRLDIPTINLGFSGSGRCEHEVADLLAELDPSAYVIDPLANMPVDTVDDHIRYLLNALTVSHPDTPVVLVEHMIFPGVFDQEKMREIARSWNSILETIYQDFAPKWNGRLYYVSSETMLGSDREATVDGTHPTDVGFLRIAEVMTPAVEKALGI
jgi:lysophospholipase L1-like esterase